MFTKIRRLLRTQLHHDMLYMPWLTLALHMKPSTIQFTNVKLCRPDNLSEPLAEAAPPAQIKQFACRPSSSQEEC